MMRTAVVIVICVVSVTVVSVRPSTGPADEILDPVDGLIQATTDSTLPLEPEDWIDWESWQPREKIAQLASAYKAGYDKEGLPVYVMEYGKWDYRGLARLSEMEQKDFDRYLDWSLRHMSKDSANNTDHEIGLITDFDGFSLKHFASSGAFKLALRSFIQVARLSQTIKYCFQVNTNYAAETFTNAAKPFMGNIFEKVEIHGTRAEKWKPRILSKIAQDQLPPQYGGSQDWKPAPFS